MNKIELTALKINTGKVTLELTIEEAKALAERINEEQRAHDEQRKALDEENKRKEAKRKAERERLQNRTIKNSLNFIITYKFSR